MMASSIWRMSHLVLAIVTSAFLLVASTTGAILAGDVAVEKTRYPYKTQSVNHISLAQSIQELRKVFPEITEINIDENQFVTLEGFDEDSNDIKAIIDPSNGNILGKPFQKSEFINQVTALHRSLFLHDIGRFLVGIIAFLFFLITISGIILIVKRQKGFFNYFSKIKKDNPFQYYHITVGRLLLIPMFLISISGTYLFMKRFKLIPEKENIVMVHKSNSLDKINPSKFPVFKNILLKNVEKIEFPFDPDDEQDYFTIKLEDREIQVNQFSGTITKQTRYPYSVLLANLSLDLHTGRANIWLAIVIGLTSVNILAFIYTGFAMTFRRKSTKIKNKYRPDESKIIILAGSENGSTISFADKIHQQLLESGYPSFLTTMNQYQIFPKAEYFLILTSTYGLGDAPDNAVRFLSLMEKYPQSQKINVSIVGFGSEAYSDFCGFAKKVDTELRKQNWANAILDLFTVNDKSPEQFTNWVKEWNQKTDILLKTTPAIYVQKPKNVLEIRVIEKTETSDSEHTFLLTLKPQKKSQFTSGDLLAIYPAEDYRERLYSIGKKDGNIQLKVKLHPFGLGSEFLNALKIDSVIKVRILENRPFHFPKKAKKVAMIANGTGIAPFLGMIHDNHRKIECHLYCGFRNETEIIKKHQYFAKDQIDKKRLGSFHIAFSKEQNHCYVMDLIERDAVFFAELLGNNGTIMICGSLIMQKDVEKTLEKILIENYKNSLEFYKSKGQILTDCY